MKKLILTALLLFIGVTTILACRCKQVTVAGGFHHANMVIHGKVISKTTVSFKEILSREGQRLLAESQVSGRDSQYVHALRWWKLEVEVKEVLKGENIKNTVTIFTSKSSSDCGVSWFETGKDAVIYGVKYFYKSYYKEDYHRYPFAENTFWTHQCTRTTPAVSEEKILIKEHLQPTKPACECNFVSVKDGIENSASIIHGKVISLSKVNVLGAMSVASVQALRKQFNAQELSKDVFQSPKFWKAEVEIIRKLKGDFQRDTIFVFSHRSGAACGYGNFKEGEEFVIYESEFDKDEFYMSILIEFDKHVAIKPLEGSIWTGLCTRTTHLIEHELKALDEELRN